MRSNSAMEADGGVDAWAAEMRQLLDLEREAELESSAARMGEKPLKVRSPPAAAARSRLRAPTRTPRRPDPR